MLPSQSIYNTEKNLKTDYQTNNDTFPLFHDNMRKEIIWSNKIKLSENRIPEINYLSPYAWETKSVDQQKYLIIVWRQNTRNKFPSPCFPSPFVHANVINEIICSKKFKIVWKQNHRRKLPSPCCHPDALLATLSSPCYHPNDTIPMISSPRSRPHVPVPTLTSPCSLINATVLILPCQCYLNNIQKH